MSIEAYEKEIESLKQQVHMIYHAECPDCGYSGNFLLVLPDKSIGLDSAEWWCPTCFSTFSVRLSLYRIKEYNKLKRELEQQKDRIKELESKMDKIVELTGCPFPGNIVSFVELHEKSLKERGDELKEAKELLINWIRREGLLVRIKTAEFLGLNKSQE